MSISMKNPENLRPSHSNQTVILIAEDEVLVANVARIALANEGYFVLTASDGEEALHISRQYPGPIHLLVSDINMPKLNGLELGEQIMDERPETQVLLMSGETALVGNRPFLRKPFLPKALRDKVHQIIKDPIRYPT